MTNFLATYLKLYAVDSFVSTEHYSLISNRTCYWSNSAINKANALLKWCPFAVDSIGKCLFIQPHKIEFRQQMTETAVHVIDNLSVQKRTTQNLNKLTYSIEN